MSDLLRRVQTEARGTSAHGLIVDYLKEQRQTLLEELSTTPDADLIPLKARVDQLERLIRDLSRDPTVFKPQKNGAYTV